MSRLAARRFRDTITRLRTAPGTYERGQYVPGPVTETDLPASVQALDVEDADFAGGARLEERLKCYVPRRDALLAAFDVCVPAADPERGAALDALVARDLLTADAADEYRPGAANEDETQVAFAADQVRHDLAVYEVEESRLWSAHTRAVLVRSS